MIMSTTQPIEINKKEGPLGFTYECYKDMLDNNIIFAYRGIVTSDLVTNVLEIMEERLEEEGQSKKFSKKVFNVMVECLTNVYVDEDKLFKEGYDPSALLLVARGSNAYKVTTGNYIPTKGVNGLKVMIDRINSMDKEELKTYYQEILCMEEPDMNGLTNLAIIDLARKSKNKLTYTFKYENNKYTFFTLESQISKSGA
jgi:hypothetical protein